MEKILENVLQKIKPSKQEEEKIKKFVSSLLDVSRNVSGHDVALVGSIGKYTWLSGDHDIDVFILFPKNTTREDLEKKGLEFGQKIVSELRGKASVKYAEHPYTHAVIQGFDVDIVPCYRIAKGEHIQSAVDRSPLHLQYILDHMSPRMQDQTRLLKQFCKGIGIYGSDAKNLGFSGYICELLILYHQTFEETLKKAALWEAPHIIDLPGSGNKAKFPGQPLIIIDPVDKERNAAAVVSVESFIKFVSAAKQFTEKPDMKYFQARSLLPMNPGQVKYLLGRGTRFYAVSFPRPDVIDDVLYPQVRKALKRLVNLINHNEFSVIRSYEYVGKQCWLIFELEIFELPPVNNQDGPPFFAHHHTQEFLSKYKGKNPIYVDDDRLVAEVKRQHRQPASLLESFFKKDKTRLMEDGLPSYIAEVIPKAKLLEQKEFFAAIAKDNDLSDYLREKYFTDIGKMI